jgi:hypothetical protein
LVDICGMARTSTAIETDELAGMIGELAAPLPRVHHHLRPAGHLARDAAYQLASGELGIRTVIPLSHQLDQYLSIGLVGRATTTCASAR